jgi:hypothetical protein
MGDPEKAADQYRHRAEEYRLAAEIECVSAAPAGSASPSHCLGPFEQR